MLSSNYVIFQRLKDIREDLDLMQQEMADLLNVSQSCYSRWETGKELIPLRKLVDFCNITNHSLDYVTGLSNKKKTNTKKIILNLDKIGKRLRKVRLENGLYQHQLAELLNTTQSTICAYEKGETLILTAFAYQIAKQFHVSLDELCGGIKKKEKETIKS